MTGCFGTANWTRRCHELLDIAVHRFSSRVAVEEVDGEQVTFAELWAEASRVAGGLKSRGVEIGDRVAIRVAAGVRWMEACLGVILAGGVPVSVGVHLSDDAADFVIADSGSVLVLDGELPHGVPFIDDGRRPGRDGDPRVHRGFLGRDAWRRVE